MQAAKLLESKWLPAGIFLAGCLLFGMNLGARDFWAPDEGDFAQVVKEMGERGDYLVPHLNGKPYPEKPPLFYWAIAFFQRLFGEPYEFSARLPSVLAGAGGLALLFWLGRRLYGARTGLAAAAILGSAYRYFWNASYLQTDMLFAFFCFLALVLFWKAKEERESAWMRAWLPFYAALAGAILTKGPLGAALVFFPIFLLAIWDRDRALLKRMRLVPGLAFVLLTTGWWYVAVWIQAGDDFLRSAIVREHLLRFADSDSHNQPPYYYFLQIWGDLAPWSLLLPTALWLAWKDRKEEAARFFFLVFLAGLLFLSICSSKQPKYLLPLWPAGALLVARSLDRSPKILLDVVSGLFLVSGLFGLWLTFGGWVPEDGLRRFFSIDLGWVRRLAPILHGFAVFAFFSFWFRDRGATLRSLLLACAGAAVFLAFTRFYSVLNPLKSHRALMERTASYMTPDAELAVFGSFRGEYAYYAGRKMTEIKIQYEEGASRERRDEQRRETLDRLDAFLSSPSPRFAVLANREWDLARGRLGEKAFQIDGEPAHTDELLLISNRPASELRQTEK